MLFQIRAMEIMYWVKSKYLYCVSASEYGYISIHIKLSVRIKIAFEKQNERTTNLILVMENFQSLFILLL